MPNLLSSLNIIKNEIASEAKRNSRNLEEIELIAVSKMQPVEKILSLYEAGQRVFGENYAQELVEKASQLTDLEIKWTFIGHLQSNKIAKIVSLASEIQTISSKKHADFIARYAVQYGKTPFPVYIEVNAGNEETKSGLPLAEVFGLGEYIKKSLPELRLRGIMAIPPFSYSDDDFNGTNLPGLYKTLGETAKKIGEGGLSLGMTGDLRMAIAAGSTCVRVGTAIFGIRGAK